jgi:hypothetical protein
MSERCAPLTAAAAPHSGAVAAIQPLGNFAVYSHLAGGAFRHLDLWMVVSLAALATTRRSQTPQRAREH